MCKYNHVILKLLLICNFDLGEYRQSYSAVQTTYASVNACIMAKGGYPSHFKSDSYLSSQSRTEALNCFVFLCGPPPAPPGHQVTGRVSTAANSRGVPRSSSTKWLKERAQVSSEDVHYILLFCGNLFPSGLQAPSSGKDPYPCGCMTIPN